MITYMYEKSKIFREVEFKLKSINTNTTFKV